jgi:hypothetical protein
LIQFSGGPCYGKSKKKYCALLNVDTLSNARNTGFMYNRITTLTLIIAGASLIAVSCGKSKPDASKYQETCAKVVQCDKDFQAIPGGQNHCQNFFLQLESKFPDTVKPMMECISTTSCEELSFQKCGEKNLQQLKGLIP